MDDIQTVLDRHWAAFGAGDVEVSLKDYSDEAVFLRPDQAYTGYDAIRAMFTDLFSGCSSPAPMSSAWMGCRSGDRRL